MKLLAFETTDAIASVALYADGEVDEIVLSTDKRHAESVLPAAEALLRAHGLSTADMDAFAADVGPGSFTGVRIGVCMANALGAAHKKPVVAVNALETLAYVFRDAQPQRDGVVCALIDARNGNGYGAVYQYTYDRAAGIYHANELMPPCACVIEDFVRTLPEGCRKIGSGTEYPMLPAAQNVARIAATRAGDAEISPLYCKLSQAERMWQA